MADAEHKAESYKPCRCGSDCNWPHVSTENRPCRGEVMAEDGFETGDYAHACRGHEWALSVAFFRDYLPESERDEWPIKEGSERR